MKRGLAGRVRVLGGDVFIMGNSAGGVHLATWLLAPQFGAERRRLVSGRGKVMRLSVAVLFAVPFYFKTASPERGDVLKAYYGNTVAQRCPFGLLEALKATELSGKGLKPAEHVRQAQLGISPVLNLEGELDPEDEILGPGRDFVELWRDFRCGGDGGVGFGGA